MLRKLLIVEDDPEDQEIVEQACEAAGFNAELCFLGNGKALLDHLQQAADEGGGDSFPDLILLDLNLPVIDGREALQRLKSDPRFSYLPVVILTTSSDSEDIRLCYQHGANSYITKPRRFPELVEAFRVLQRYWGFTQLPRR